MTIASQTSRISYVGDGATTSFPIPFLFQSNADITVMLQSSAGVQTTLTLGTGYTLTGAGVSSGGTATITPAPTALSGAVITIFRDPPVTQTTSYNNNDPFPAKSHENALDKLTMLEQRSRDLGTRSLQLRESDAAVDMHLPANRQNKLLGFDGSNNPIAVFGPSFVGSTDIGAAIVSTKAVAQVTTFAGTVLYLVIGGTSVAGDATQTTYIRGTGAGAFTDGSGVSWKPVPTPAPVITTFGVAVIGDGVTDDRAAMQASIDALSAIGGGTIYGAPGKTYRCVINTGVTDLGLILKPNVTLDLNRTTIALECTGSVYGIRLQNDAHIRGPGIVKTTVSSGPGSQDIYHAPISLGAAYGEITSVSALGNYINATRWSVRQIKVDNVRSGGYCIAGIGGVNHGVVEDIEFPDSALIIGCINFDWGTVGAMSSAVADIPTTRAVFDAGAGYTVHPNNISINRLKIGAMTNASSCPIRLSGVHDIRIDGFEIASCSADGVFHTAGDLGYEFADSDTKRRRHSGIVVKNGLIRNAGTGGAIYCDAYADNIALAVAGGYSALLGYINTTDIVFESIRSISGTFSGTAGDGVTARLMEGGTFRNCVLIGHLHGIVAADGAKRVRIEGGEINACWNEGVYIGAGTVPEEITVDGIWCWSNGVGGAGTSGVMAFNGKFHNIMHCRLGANAGGDSFQTIGITVGSACAGVRVTANHVLAASNVAYKMAAAGFFGSVAVFSGNTLESAVTTAFGGVEIICIERAQSGSGGYRRFLMSRTVAATTPASGAWLAGDTIEFSDPVSGGYKGTVCVTSGSPGTWKNYGLIT